MSENVVSYVSLFLIGFALGMGICNLIWVFCG